jgi:hypothetical protein
VWIGLQTKFHSTTLAFCDFSKVRYASNLESLRNAAIEKGINPAGLGRCDVDISTLNTTVKMLRADLGLANKFKANVDDLLKFFQNSGMDEELVDVFFRQPLAESQNAISDTKYDIFISFKNLDNRGERTLDSYMAEELHNFLTQNKLRVFMSNKSLEELGTAKFKEAIDSALDAAAVLVVVATSTEYLNSPWVSYEWNSFFNDILSNVKPTSQVFTYVRGISPSELPRSLRQVQSFQAGDEGREKLHQFLAHVLNRA